MTPDDVHFVLTRGSVVHGRLIFSREQIAQAMSESGKTDPNEIKDWLEAKGVQPAEPLPDPIFQEPEQ